MNLFNLNFIIYIKKKYINCEKIYQFFRKK